jgi:hypothetical protein
MQAKRFLLRQIALLCVVMGSSALLAQIDRAVLEGTVTDPRVACGALQHKRFESEF